MSSVPANSKQTESPFLARHRRRMSRVDSAIARLRSTVQAASARRAKRS